uniref:Serine carboxypeptidase-like 18 n=1 Tax=Davidia involucrata TaxID=16924 RepID=A0A5B7BNJ9_DAVIN
MAPSPPTGLKELRSSSFTSGKYTTRLFFQVLFLFVLSSVAVSKSIIETLPGYSGNLPFKLETGYVSVGELDDVQLFYYFIESERNPVKDPLLLWLTGGPGCSGFSGLTYENIGPLNFDVPAFNGSLPTFQLNPYSWTQVANIIFLDAPVGTGFSYATTSSGYTSSDTKAAKDTYKFLRKWLMDHPKFSKNPLYITGDSYGGMQIPMIVLEISNGNEAGLKPHMYLQGYMIGNPVTAPHNDINSRFEFAHRVSLISDELYELAKSYCEGEYITPDPNNSDCMDELQLITESISKVNQQHILEPKCSVASAKPNQFFDDNSADTILPFSQVPELWCRNHNYVLSYVWANDQSVQEALNIRNGTITDWKRCNQSLSYVYDVESVVSYHQILSKKGYRALIYSGDHDMVIPYVGTQKWIASLNLTTEDSWRPWFVEGQIAGYTEKYAQNGYRMTFATVKGGGHTAPEYKPKQCLAMVDRWFSYYML